MNLTDDAIRASVRAALDEDIGPGDVTTDAVVPPDSVSRATIVANEDGVLAGLDVALAVWRELDSGLRVLERLEDGARLTPGSVAAVVEGRTRALLSGERVALNFLQHLSGVATGAARCAALLKGSRTTVLDTRKTLPGLRVLEKYAVSVGGGENHRMGLWDMALVKDNHIAAAGGIARAVERVRGEHPDLPLEVEVTNRLELEEALAAGADRVMLDNMSREEMRRAIEIVGSRPDPPEVEISGRVTEEDLGDLGALGADFISIGALTHSVRALDLRVDLEGVD